MNSIDDSCFCWFRACWFALFLSLALEIRLENNWNWKVWVVAFSFHRRTHKRFVLHRTRKTDFQRKPAFHISLHQLIFISQWRNTQLFLCQLVYITINFTRLFKFSSSFLFASVKESRANEKKLTCSRFSREFQTHLTRYTMWYMWCAHESCHNRRNNEQQHYRDSRESVKWRAGANKQASRDWFHLHYDFIYSSWGRFSVTATARMARTTL